MFSLGPEGHTTTLPQHCDHVFRLHLHYVYFSCGYSIWTPRPSIFLEFFLVTKALLRCRIFVEHIFACSMLSPEFFLN